MQLLFGISFFFSILLLGKANANPSNLPLAQAGKSQFGGIPVVCHLQQIGKEPEQLNKLLDSYLTAKEYTLALQLIEKSGLSDFQVSALNQIVSSYIEAKQKDKAIPLLSQALQIARGMKNSFAKVEALLKTGNNLIAIGRKNQAIETFSLGVQEVLALHKIPTVPSLPDVNEDSEAKYAIFLTQFAAGYIAGGKSDQAVKVLAQSLKIAQALENKTSQANVLLGLSIQYDAAGQGKKAQELLTQSLKIVHNVDENQQTITLLMIAQQLFKAKQLDKLSVVMESFLQIAQKTKNEAARVFMFGSIASTWLAIDRDDKAITIANSLEDPYTKTKVLNSLAYYYLEANKTEKGLAILNQSYAVAQTIQDRTKRDYALVFISAFYATANKINRALEVTEKIEDGDRQSIAWKLIAEELVKAKKFDQVLQLAPRMEKDEVGGALAAIAIAYANVGKSQQAMDLVKNIDSEYYQLKALIAIANHYLQLGQLQPAFNTAQLISTVKDKSDILAAIALAYGESGEYPKATEVAQAIPEINQRNSLIKLLTCANQKRL
ncbi:Tetratricopeptide repeat protein [Nostoc sp. DSM 114161]|jgi:tetratricopeptide (TPR) repeat protein|uniref:tetratricopeptide repeat protein n=1 Tax=Nostoc sp. DSM 114161 TaxID=3440143 RepID=UPI004045611B